MTTVCQIKEYIVTENDSFSKDAGKKIKYIRAAAWLSLFDISWKTMKLKKIFSDDGQCDKIIQHSTKLETII